MQAETSAVAKVDVAPLRSWVEFSVHEDVFFILPDEHSQGADLVTHPAFLAPFIIGALYILFSGIIIYAIDALHDLVIFSLIILVGNLMHKIWKKPFLTALLQSFLLFFLLLPRGQMTLLF